MDEIKKILKKSLNKFPLTRKYMYGRTLYGFYKNSYDVSRSMFLGKHWKKLYYGNVSGKKIDQINKLIKKIDITPVDNKSFFYSIDCFKTVELKNHILDNYSVDYTEIVCGSLKKIEDELSGRNSEYDKTELNLIKILKLYYMRCMEDNSVTNKYKNQLDAIGSLFERPARTFFEGLQRILFFNQFLWQTKHKHNGFGHLDWMLIDLYRADLETGNLTEDEADELIRDFFRVLHENCWFKSTMLLGDTGQIIILGGLDKEGNYNYNELTYKFIKISMELKLPDPKVLLRCSTKMPDDLIELAVDCIETGIGAPFISNDDAVIPALIDFGYDAEDAYNYATAACWEPLILNNSCDQNNICSISFAKPFVEMMESKDFNMTSSIDDLLKLYKLYLHKYLAGVLRNLSHLEFEEDPFLSLLSKSSRKEAKDIVRGGAKYSNLGVTSVGMSTVVNSILNIKQLVFDTREYSLDELNNIRKENYKGHEELIKRLKEITPCYGSDAPDVIELTKTIENYATEEFKKHLTKLGGKFKFGLSSPNYIVDANNTAATLDGRKNGEPFTVHISSSSPIPPTELISFAMKLDYMDNRINGNVVDLFATPNILKQNKQKYILMLKSAFKGGMYQLQMNVIDSATLIEAKKNPEKFPNLVVRVWGFSAYFKDLPEEYKELIIARAIECEKIA